ncbi:hypothetical protein INT48_007769 [Thamnidium elegans]|uniref:Uncharacterized protein n=1 Tax=Thamnidium elegans TaxID=101142 RepID=A0A8H7VYG7_9FUNG|nr:hypothetical protein INT48_007769 [Thamnidium elegans]
MFTVKHVGKADLLADNAAKAYKTAGLLLNGVGWVIKPQIELSLKGVKSLPLNKGLGPLEDLLKTKTKKRLHIFCHELDKSKKILINAL